MHVTFCHSLRWKSGLTSLPKMVKTKSKKEVFSKNENILFCFSLHDRVSH
jgi:hypothetical protein